MSRTIYFVKMPNCLNSNVSNSLNHAQQPQGTPVDTNSGHPGISNQPNQYGPDVVPRRQSTDAYSAQEYHAGYSQCMNDVVKHLTKMEDALKFTKSVIQQLPVSSAPVMAGTEPNGWAETTCTAPGGGGVGIEESRYGPDLYCNNTVLGPCRRSDESECVAQPFVGDFPDEISKVNSTTILDDQFNRGISQFQIEDVQFNCIPTNTEEPFDKSSRMEVSCPVVPSTEPFQFDRSVNISAGKGSSHEVSRGMLVSNTSNQKISLSKRRYPYDCSVEQVINISKNSELLDKSLETITLNTSTKYNDFSLMDKNRSNSSLSSSSESSEEGFMTIDIVGSLSNSSSADVLDMTSISSDPAGSLTEFSIGSSTLLPSGNSRTSGVNIIDLHSEEIVGKGYEISGASPVPERSFRFLLNDRSLNGQTNNISPKLTEGLKHSEHWKVSTSGSSSGSLSQSGGAENKKFSSRKRICGIASKFSGNTVEANSRSSIGNKIRLEQNDKSEQFKSPLSVLLPIRHDQVGTPENVTSNTVHIDTPIPSETKTNYYSKRRDRRKKFHYSPYPKSKETLNQDLII